MADGLSLTGKQWTARGSADLEAPLGVESPRALCDFLVRERGIAVGEDRKGTHFGLDPTAFPDLPRAIERLQTALEKKETIGIVGDYDCDGITSSALLIRALERRGARPVVRLPHRAREGYGLKLHHVDAMDAADVTLLFTLDTGITAAAEIAEAKSRGIDVIILDHHRLPATLPSAFAILHPELADPRPLSSPAAAGVTWMFVRALEAADGHELWDGIATDLALAMIGTVADLVELRGENRSLVLHGLTAFSQLTEGPLALLALQAGLQQEHLTSRDVAFRIAPRLNAAGRMADPAIALRALLGDHHALVQLEELNTQRQSLVTKLATEMFAQLSQLGNADAPFFCTIAPHYLPGICGLLAGKASDKLGRPSLVGYAHPDGTCTASLRSIPGYDVTAALTRNADLLLHFGGHAQAAGCSFRAESFAPLRERLCADAAEHLSTRALVPSLFVDACVDPRLLTLDLCEHLRALEPFGQANPEPVFLLRNVTLQDIRTVGHDDAHLQARLRDTKLIGFHMGTLKNQLPEAMDIACRLSINVWQGTHKPQLMLDDVRPATQSADQTVVHTGANFPSMVNTSVTSDPSAAAIL